MKQLLQCISGFLLMINVDMLVIRMMLQVMVVISLGLVVSQMQSVMVFRVNLVRMFVVVIWVCVYLDVKLQDEVVFMQGIGVKMMKRRLILCIVLLCVFMVRLWVYLWMVLMIGQMNYSNMRLLVDSMWFDRFLVSLFQCWVFSIVVGFIRVSYSSVSGVLNSICVRLVWWLNQVLGWNSGRCRFIRFSQFCLKWVLCCCLKCLKILLVLGEIWVCSRLLVCRVDMSCMSLCWEMLVLVLLVLVQVVFQILLSVWWLLYSDSMCYILGVMW